MRYIIVASNENRMLNAIVDDSDYVRLAKYTWIDVNGYPYAVVGRAKLTARLKSMHQMLIVAPKGWTVDHKNRNPLDNQRLNLRVCTYQQNSFNQSIRSDNTSGYRGVYWSKAKRKWRARIRHSGVSVEGGYYKTAEEAAFVYDQIAEQLFGEYAYLNLLTHEANGSTGVTVSEI